MNLNFRLGGGGHPLFLYLLFEIGYAEFNAAFPTLMHESLASLSVQWYDQT